MFGERPTAGDLSPGEALGEKPARGGRKVLPVPAGVACRGHVQAHHSSGSITPVSPAQHVFEPYEGLF
jgi:hypothetical protein